MKQALLAATAALILAAVGNAAADERDDLGAFEASRALHPIFAGSLAFGGGGEAYPAFSAASSVPVIAGTDAVLPTDGSESAVQTAASLPLGFTNGTPSYVQAQSVRQYLVERETRARLAARSVSGGHRS